MTTVAAFGQYDAELMCYAHSKGARLVLKGRVRLDIISKFSVFYKHDVACISNQTRFLHFLKNMCCAFPGKTHYHNAGVLWIIARALLCSCYSFIGCSV